MIAVPRGREGKEAPPDFLAFIAHGLKVFGPKCSVWMQIGAHESQLTFPPDPSWSPPPPKQIRVQTCARSLPRR